MRGRVLLVALWVLAAACEPPSPSPSKKPVALTKLPSPQELAGRYDEESTRKSIKKTLMLREDGTFTLTTQETQQKPNTLTGTWTSRQIPLTGLLELKATPFFMPDGKTPVDSLAMPIERVTTPNRCSSPRRSVTSIYPRSRSASS